MRELQQKVSTDDNVNRNQPLVDDWDFELPNTHDTSHINEQVVCQGRYRQYPM
ncbi:hypothetical protein BAUCODRAFT_37381 [Baudoinia panamericana UAMH 10762]|uniref:Uncharacterized protein n=1 Tax=Baudoinia panamericana (strain UAMH 10762) TaxID=717646 RepID=M2MB15_BAUPA|nr:uncharacterized protein BAUCODRAFT_37381 [Baudoinia panamericana UAMH 10762]EMC93666.1 hypothetical protein BAUCODRAFT_37381 [Baudoinia panamericana UAMH 10762]